MRSFFVTPGMVRLPLEGHGIGNYIQIKRQLNVGEERRAFARCVKKVIAGEAAELDPEQIGKTRICEYMLGWDGPGFTMPDGTPVEFSEGALLDLEAEAFGAITDAIGKHERAQAAAREAEKNGTDGGNVSGQISPSASS